MKARNIITSTLAAAVLTTLTIAPLHAEDSKLYPASSCVKVSGSTPALSFSRLFNPGTGRMGLDCPVVHDNPLRSIQDGYVDVIDQNFANNTTNNPDTQVCAELVSLSQAFSSTITFRSTGRKCSTGANSVSQRLSFGGLPTNGNAHYYYSVTIPGTFNGQRSGIVTYRVDEND